VKRVAIELDVTLDLQVLTGFQQRPRRRRQTHAAHVKAREARAALIKDVIDPGQRAFARTLVSLLHEAIDKIVRQTVALDDDDAFGLGRCSRHEDQGYDESHPQITQIKLGQVRQMTPCPKSNVRILWMVLAAAPTKHRYGWPTLSAAPLTVTAMG